MMSHPIVPEEVVIRKIYVIRGHKVMLDRDLAELFGVETKALKQAVRRNINRFPEDFMFEMNKDEFANWRSQFVTSNLDRQGLRYAPFCFTEHGVLMLASVINNAQAIALNIHIIRIFIKLRELMINNDTVQLRLEQVERITGNHDEKIELLFTYISRLMEKPEISVTKIKGFEVTPKNSNP
jgi:phage regulator Rha-like protein